LRCGLAELRCGDAGDALSRLAVERGAPGGREVARLHLLRGRHGHGAAQGTWGLGYLCSDFNS